MWSKHRSLRLLALVLILTALLGCVSCGASNGAAMSRRNQSDEALASQVELSLLTAGEPELSAAVALPGTAPETAEPEETSAEPARSEPEEEPTAAPVGPTATLRLAEQPPAHQPVMTGYPDGTFRPEEQLTRAEAAQIFYALLSDRPQDRAACADVAESAWYYDPVCLLVSGGALELTGNRARPEDPITRAEFVALAARLTPEGEGSCDYTDLSPGDPWYAEIAKATALGWVTGYADGTFRPSEPITRAQAAIVTCRVLGRRADADSIPFSLEPYFSDVSTDHWAYNEIMEAALSHVGFPTQTGDEIWTWADTSWVVERPRLPEGLYFDGAELYLIGPSGYPVANTYYGSLYFGDDGRYTSGDAEIDGYAKAIVESVTTPEMTQLEKLRAGFNYVRDSYTYLRRHYYSVGYTDWVMEEARTMYTTGLGNCYCYAGAFYYVARQLGYDARIISGTTGYNRAPHGWVEIDFDGVTYIFDTELEMAYRKKGIYYYDFFMMPYTAVPWPYNK